MLHILQNINKLYRYYKSLGDKAFEQITEADINWQYEPESNSIGLVVKHLSGNMRSRFSDFLVSDGEKPWRQRDQEFEGMYSDKAAMVADWEQGWTTVFEALDGLTDEDLEKTIYIRGEKHSVLEALHRQLGHYPYHVGQIVLLAKMRVGAAWQSLSIPKNGSVAFNKTTFSKHQ